MTRHAAPLLALALLALVPASAAAQARVYGTVRDSTQGIPLPLVEVLVEGMNLSALTDASGRFSLSIPLGFHTIRFRRVGYHPVTRQLRLATTDSVRLDLAMLDQAQQLDSGVVVAEAPPRTWPPGFDARKKEGFGQFVTDSALRRFEHTTLSNVLQSRVGRVRFKRLLGRNVAFSSRGGGASISARGRIEDCYYSIWLDGVLIYEFTPTDPSDPTQRIRLPPDLDRFTVVGLEAIEVYTAAQVPSQYRGGSTGCGAILLWTRTQRR